MSKRKISGVKNPKNLKELIANLTKDLPIEKNYRPTIKKITESLELIHKEKKDLSNNDLPKYAKNLKNAYLCSCCQTYVEYEQAKYTGVCWSCQDSIEKEDSGINEAERYD